MSRAPQILKTQYDEMELPRRGREYNANSIDMCTISVTGKCAIGSLWDMTACRT